jgi:hypothetical protein
MGKRILAAVLWFFSGWYFGAFIAFVTGVPPALGPVLGIAAAVLIAADPRRIIWTRPAPTTSTVVPELSPKPV